eukprot:297291_1
MKFTIIFFLSCLLYQPDTSAMWANPEEFEMEHIRSEMSTYQQTAQTNQPTLERLHENALQTNTQLERKLDAARAVIKNTRMKNQKLNYSLNVARNQYTRLQQNLHSFIQQNEQSLLKIQNISNNRHLKNQQLIGWMQNLMVNITNMKMEAEAIKLELNHARLNFTSLACEYKEYKMQQAAKIRTIIICACILSLIFIFIFSLTVVKCYGLKRQMKIQQLSEIRFKARARFLSEGKPRPVLKRQNKLCLANNNAKIKSGIDPERFDDALKNGIEAHNELVKDIVEQMQTEGNDTLENNEIYIDEFNDIDSIDGDLETIIS